MIVISDSTPIITLMKAARLEVLQQLFGEVLIPESVYFELTTNEAFREEAMVIRDNDYIKLVKVEDSERVLFLQRATGLDLGESEAIIYADTVQADLLLMDELAGRKVAQNMNLPITGSIGILIRAFKEGALTISEIEDALQRIKDAKRHISEQLIDYALNIIHGDN